MGYIGRKPTDAALTSSDIADGIISTADLAANAVTGAKVNTDVISAQTALAAAPADTDEFLVSDAGTIKRIDYSLIKGGGQWENLTTTTISSNTAQIIFNATHITSAHRDYCIVMSDFTLSADAVPRMVISEDNGSNYLATSNYKYAMRSYKSDNSTNSKSSGNQQYWELTGDTVEGSSHQSSRFVLTINDPLSTATRTTISITGFMLTSGGLACGCYGGGTYANESTAKNAFKLYLSTGNYATGTFTLYGRKI